MSLQTPQQTTPTHPRDADVQPSTSRQIMWLVAALAVILVAALALWFVFDGESTPTVTFDGTMATYDGPSSFEAGEVTFEFDGSAHEPGVAFVVVEITDDSITVDDMKAWEADHTAREVPGFTGTYTVTMATEGDRIVEKTVDLQSGKRYALTANTSPTDTDRVHTAAIIEVD